MRAMTVDVKSLLKEGAELTDRALEELLPSVETVPASIHGAMRHSVFAGGKRLRPVLAMQAASHHCRRPARGHRAAGRGAGDAAHLFADPRRPARAGQRRSAPRQAHLPRGLRRGHRDSGRRRAADARLRSAGRAGLAARGDGADHRPHRQRRGHGGRHDRRPGAGHRERTPEAHAGSWWRRFIAPRPAR